MSLVVRFNYYSYIVMRVWNSLPPGAGNISFSSSFKRSLECINLWHFVKFMFCFNFITPTVCVLLTARTSMYRRSFSCGKVKFRPHTHRPCRWMNKWVNKLVKRRFPSFPQCQCHCLAFPLQSSILPPTYLTPLSKNIFLYRSNFTIFTNTTSNTGV